MASANDINFAFSVWQVSKYYCISDYIYGYSLVSYVVCMKLLLTSKFRFETM